ALRRARLMNPLLAQQLRECDLDPQAPPATPEAWQAFLQRIATTYETADHERSKHAASDDLQALQTRLQGERDTLDALIESLGEGLVVFDEQDRVVRVNPEAERLLEQEAASLLGHTIVSLMDSLGVPRSAMQERTGARQFGT